MNPQYVPASGVVGQAPLLDVVEVEMVFIVGTALVEEEEGLAFWTIGVAPIPPGGPAIAPEAEVDVVVEVVVDVDLGVVVVEEGVVVVVDGDVVVALVVVVVVLLLVDVVVVVVPQT